jgi:molybdopterin adenylyltransferase
MVLAARDLADELDQQQSCTTGSSGNNSTSIAALDAFGYDEAAEHVYGMRYDQWKQRYQREATAEEMTRYQASQSIHAQHDKSRLAPQQNQQRVSSSTAAAANGNNNVTTASNVCCEPTPLPKARETSSRAVKDPYIYTGSFKLGVLTVSDRASRGAYDTGDLSGPAVVETLKTLLTSDNNNIANIAVAIVADDKQEIQSRLVKWCDDDNVDVILTTGGTGFARRDVTPEATSEILDAEWRTVMALSSRANVLARGTAGFRKNTVIANLPGNPQAAREMLPDLLPILWKATLELQQDGKDH